MDNNRLCNWWASLYEYQRRNYCRSLGAYLIVSIILGILGIHDTHIGWYFLGFLNASVVLIFLIGFVITYIEILGEKLAESCRNKKFHKHQ